MGKLLISLADRWYGFTPDTVLSALEQSQFWPRERLENLQIEHLRKLLIHAGAHVPFYRDLFKRLDFDPRAVRSLADVQCLPILGKPEIMAERDRFISETAPRPRVSLKTTGTTGQPFSFVRTRLAQSYKIASRVRFRRWHGIERTDPLLNVGGIPSRHASLKERIWDAVHFHATNRINVFSSDLEQPEPEFAVRLIEKHRLKAIMGYPTGIAALANYVARRRPLAHRPKAIFTNCETLTELMRRQIREAFGIEPRNDYIATEGAIAHECPEGGLHVNMEETLVELVPGPNTEDGAGEVITTFLHTFDFPLIRYRLGDLAAWADQPCPCGRGLATLGNLFGRTADGIELPDGRVFTAANINMRIAHFPFIHHVGQYQIAQTGYNTIELRMLNTAAVDEKSVLDFQKSLARLFVGLEVEVKRLKELPRESTGKFRPVIGLKKGVAPCRTL